MDLHFFIKFGKKENIEMLKNEGLLYLSTADYFKKCDEPERGDKNENLGMLFQSDQIEIEIKHPTLGNLKLNKSSGLTGQVTTSTVLEDEHIPATHIYSMVCKTNNNIDIESGKFFDERLYEFGDTALFIINSKEFINRCENALREAYERKEIIDYKTKIVEYVDFNSHHGKIGPFKKSTEYRHQDEFRLALHVPQHDQAYKLKIGDLNDISIQMNKKDIQNKIYLNQESQSLQIEL